jgi:hypothetical protein
LPALADDSAYVTQLGLLHWRLGRPDTAEARLFQAKLMEREGKYGQALEAYQSLMIDSPRGSSVQRAAGRALLRAAGRALNSGRADRAAGHLEVVLAHEPCNLRANYVLQLAYLRLDRRAELERLVARFESTYSCFQIPTKLVAISFGQENLAIAAHLEGDLDDAVVHGYRAKHPDADARAYRVRHPAD